MRVILNIAESPQQYPVWQDIPNCLDEKTIPEDIQVNSVIVRCIALPGSGFLNGRIQYRQVL